MSVAAVALSGMVSAVFSMVGEGGSKVMVPMPFRPGLDFKSAAIPPALLMSAITCFSAGAVCARRGQVVFRATLPFAVAVLAGSSAGTPVHFRTLSRTLMLVFALTNILVGFYVRKGKRLERGAFPRKALLVVGVSAGLVGFTMGLIARDGAPSVMATPVMVGFEEKEAAGTALMIAAAGSPAAFFTCLYGARVGREVVMAGAWSAPGGFAGGFEVDVKAHGFEYRQAPFRGGDGDRGRRDTCPGFRVTPDPAAAGSAQDVVESWTAGLPPATGTGLRRRSLKG